MDGRISAAAQLALADQLPLPMIVKCGWSGFVPLRRAIGYIRITGFIQTGTRSEIGVVAVDLLHRFLLVVPLYYRVSDTEGGKVAISAACCGVHS